VTFTPDLYACGVDYVGVSNIFTWLDGIPPYWTPYREMLHEMVGHPENDKELLEAASPLFHVDRIQVPLLVAQGANDVRVPQSESDMIVEALQSRGIDVPYMVKEDEGHGFGNEENRFDLYREMERFLGQHLGGRVESPAEGS
jgi:dipeptidyl aminopeptidase/acylaminoacyl peptidase